MEKETEQKSAKKKGGGYAWFWIGGFMWSGISKATWSNENVKTLSTAVGLASIIAACYFYYWVKEKVKYPKNDFLKSILLGALSCILFSFLDGLVMAWFIIFVFHNS
ncbi:MAG: hypothetical protein NTZ25_01170 [Candidatus Peregrinibacteria bacterium]|nr:hypothetical protein [Candidatus Peregrinibacteria bacterium]